MQTKTQKRGYKGYTIQIIEHSRYGFSSQIGLEYVGTGVSSFSTALSIAKERIDYLTSNKKENPNVPTRERC